MPRMNLIVQAGIHSFILTGRIFIQYATLGIFYINLKRKGLEICSPRAQQHASHAVLNTSQGSINQNSLHYANHIMHSQGKFPSPFLKLTTRWQTLLLQPLKMKIFIYIFFKYIYSLFLHCTMTTPIICLPRNTNNRNIQFFIFIKQV